MDNREIWEKILQPNLKRTNLKTLEARLCRISKKNGLPELEVARRTNYCFVFYEDRYIATVYEFNMIKPSIKTFPENEHQEIVKIWQTLESMYKKR